MVAGTYITSRATATIPLGTNPGSYYAKIRATTSNAGFDDMLLNLTVLENRSWLRTPDTFGAFLAALNTSGNLGNITINNTGNVKTNFDLLKGGDNGLLNIEGFSSFSFEIEKQVSRVIHINFSVAPNAIEGIFNVTILIRNLSAEPAQRNVTVVLNVTDPPPTLFNIIVTTEFEFGYENISIQTDAVDNFGVDKVWTNVSTPFSTNETFNLTKLYNNTYHVNYTVNETGRYVIVICANDTSSKMTCTGQINASSSNTTLVRGSPQPASIVIDNITVEYAPVFTINSYLNNTGGSRAFNASLNITESQQNITIGGFFYHGQMLKLTSKLNLTNLTISPFTVPGTYPVNFEGNWTNLDNSTNTSLIVLQVNVSANPQVNLTTGAISSSVIDGQIKTVQSTLRSYGNVNASGVTINCISGVACINFSTSFGPSDIATFMPNTTQQMNVTISVPSQFKIGTYQGIIEINWTPARTLLIPLVVVVPANISWTHKEGSLNRTAFTNENGTFGTVNVTNTGNLEITLNLTFTGDITNLMRAPENVTIAPGASSIIQINFSTQDIVNDTQNFTGMFITNLTGGIRANASFTEVGTNLTLTVIKFNLIIMSPTTVSPITGVIPDQNLTIIANVSDNETATGNVTFFLKLYNATNSSVAAPNITYAFDSGTLLWNITFLAPSLDLNKAYNINLTATYNKTTNTSNTTRTRSVVQIKSIVYNDTVVPSITNEIPFRVTLNTLLIIRTNITEFGILGNVTSNVTLPKLNQSDNDTVIITNSYIISENDDLYIYLTNSTNTIMLGTYTFRLKACDTAGNCNTSTETFDIYPTTQFAGNAKDVELITEAHIGLLFTLNDLITGYKRFIFGTNNSNGNYNETVDVKIYNIDAELTNTSMLGTVRLLGANVSGPQLNPIKFGRVRNARTTSSSLKGLYIESTLNYSSAEITIDFSECLSGECGNPIFDPRHLGIYKYGASWSPKFSASNNEQWTRIANTAGDNTDNSVNLTSLKIKGTTTSVNGVYVLAEFICGNTECESEMGESVNNCPTDCPFIPVTQGGGQQQQQPPPSAGGAGSAGGAPPKTTGAAENVPFEVKADLLEIGIAPGEEKTFSIDVKNNRGAATTVTITVEGPVFGLITVQKPSFSLAAKTTEVVLIKAYASPTTAPGKYTGEITVKSGEVTHTTPVTILVRSILVPLLDVQTKVLSKTVDPADKVLFEVSVINKGETEKIEDITLTYRVRPVQNDNETITTFKETVAVENILTFRRTMDLPDTAPQGQYILDVVATYWYGNKTATSADDFEILSIPIPLQILRAVFLNWLTYVVVMGGLPIAIIGRKVLVTRLAMRKAKSRYGSTVDFNALPKPGPNSIKIGKIAETNKDAYIDISQLLMHSIAAGGTGSGKSVSAQVVTEELLKRKVPIIVFDPTAQWTGFMKANKLKVFFDLYPKFGIKPEEATGFKTNVILVEDPTMPVNIKDHMKPGEITVFVMNRLPPEKLDDFVRRSIQSVFDMRPQESKEIKLLLVYDEVHRLLPKYGGKKGYTAIERAAREFRKWGIGVFLISQVLLDFKGAIRANIANEIQLRTKYEGDIGRVKSKYGMEYASKVTKLTIGTGLFQNPEFNNGKPWFINFRPLLHNPFALTDEEINQYIDLSKKVAEIDAKIAEMKKAGKDTYDIEIELNIAKDKIKTAAFKMADTYIESVKKRLEKTNAPAPAQAKQ